MSELKKCPFCGGEGKYHRGVCKVEGGFSDFVVVFCVECGARTKKVFYDKNKHGIEGEYEEVKEAWNRRGDGREVG